MADLGKVVVNPRGTYDPEAVYEKIDMVEHEGSSYLALKKLLKGITPSDDGVNWQLHGRGYPGNATGITVQDTQGLVVAAGQNTNEQALINAISEQVATKLLLKEDVISQIINDASKAASMAALFSVNQKVTQINSDFTKYIDGLLLQNQTNLNNVRTPGHYVTKDNASARTMSNIPPDYTSATMCSFDLFVYPCVSLKDNQVCTQLLVTYAGNYGRLYFREYNYGSWGSWKKIATSDDLEHNWENITIGIFATAATVQRYGLVKRIKINTYLKNTSTGVTGNQAYTLATLAANYRPKTSVVINAVVGRSSSGTTSTPIFARLEIGTDGIMTLTPFQNITTNAISLDITYI